MAGKAGLGGGTGARQGVLAVLRLVDFSSGIAGPISGMLLADHGAEVLKIEEPEHGDDSRGWGPYINGWSSFYLALNRSKKSVALDLKSADGANALRRLIATADVLIENFRPGVMARLGLGYEALHKLKPSLVYCAISGYGQEGPMKDAPAYDQIIQGLSGVMTAGTALFSNRLPPRNLKSLTGKISPTPVFFIYADRGAGDEDNNPDYYKAARAPKQIWKIATSHTHGLSARPQEYERRVIGFFDRTLLVGRKAQ